MKYLIKYNRFLVLFTPISILGLFELFLIQPKILYYSIIIANLLVFFTIKQFKKSSAENKEWINFIILPICFLTSLGFYSTLIANNIFIQILFFANIFFIYFYLRNIYFYLVQPESYKTYALENISSYGNFLVIFFASSAIYGMQAFLNISVWILILIILPLIALVIYQIIWANKINIKDGFVYIFLGCLILIEIAWAITFLPLAYNIAGLVLAICYYILIGLIRFYLKKNLNKQTIKLYLFFGFSSILIILLTAKWV